jgi:hypothetical protein
MLLKGSRVQPVFHFGDQASVTDRLPQLVVCSMRIAITGCCAIRIAVNCG